VFKKKQYQNIFLPYLEGEDHGIKVSFKNFLVRESEDLEKNRIEYFPDFNTFLIESIWKEITDFEIFIAKARIEPVLLTLKIRNCDPISLKILLNEDKTKRQFMAEMPDAIIKAFDQERIGR